MIQIDGDDSVFGSLIRIDNYLTLFNHSTAIIIPAFIERKFAEQIRDNLIHCNSSARHVYDVDSAEVISCTVYKDLLTNKLNRPSFLRHLELVVGLPCNTIQSFRGSFIKRESDKSHFSEWHSDVGYGENRLYTLSINFSVNAFDGGSLLIRNNISKEIVFSYANNILGDAVIFKVLDDYDHKVEDVIGPVPRTVFVGWILGS